MAGQRRRIAPADRWKWCAGMFSVFAALIIIRQPGLAAGFAVVAVVLGFEQWPRGRT